jgi:hypothetical protein
MCRSTILKFGHALEVSLVEVAIAIVVEAVAWEEAHIDYQY